MERGGRGECCFVLLHGLGATGAVWSGLLSLLESHQLGRHVIVDLPGHGDSARADSYAIESITAALAPSLQDIQAPIIIGHSLGAYVALALASGAFGVSPAAVLAIGPKVTWSAADLGAIGELALKPARIFATEAEAVARYRKVAGLDERIAPSSAALMRGVVRDSNGWRLACDPRAVLAGGSAAFGALAREARCPYIFARGERDPLVTLQELREIAGEAQDIVGFGHNVHVEAPDSLLPLVRKAMSA